MPNIFGFPTPQELQQAQFAQNLQLLAQARPGQAVGAVAGQNLGNAIGDAFGLENSQMGRARKMQEAQAEVAQSGIAPGQDGYLEAVTQALVRRGLGAEAQQAQATYAKFQEQILKTEKLNQEVSATRRRNEAIKARGPYAETFSLLLEDQTADKKNALNIANSTDAATLMAQAGVDRNIYAAFLDGVANDVQTVWQTNVQTTTGSTRENLDTGATSSSSTRSARISSIQLRNIVDRNLRELGIDLGSLRTSQGQSQATRPQISINPQQIQRSQVAQAAPQAVARSPITNQPYVQGAPHSGQYEPRQPTTELPVTNDGRTMPKRELRKGKVLQGGRDYTLEDVSRASKDGRVSFGSARTKEQIRSQMDLDPATIRDQNKKSFEALKISRTQTSDLNDLSEYILREGIARPALVGQAIRAVNEITRGREDLLSSGARLGAAMASFLDFTDPKDRKILDGIARRITKLRLTEKEAQNLGVLNGPDLQLVSKLFPSPSDYTNRVNGVRAWYENASGIQEGLYRGASNQVNDGGIKRFDMPSPTTVMRFFSHIQDQDIAPIISAVEQGTTTPARAATRISKTLGFQVTPRMVNLAAAQGDFTPQGTAVETAVRSVEQAIGGTGREALGLSPQVQELTPQQRQFMEQLNESPLDLLRNRIRRALGE